MSIKNLLDGIRSSMRPIVAVLTHSDMAELKAHPVASKNLNVTPSGIYIRGTAIIAADVEQSYLVCETRHYEFGPEIKML